ncbi:hypothetical protein LJC42_04560 [Eubacteriales bacterium OttesenSCG-928-K08]|nr:hypothetical protein [Eubacteriales bacterium OttesenSCG-928-K08]
MQKLKYRVVRAGAAGGVVPMHLAFIDRSDVIKAGISNEKACQLVGAQFTDGVAINVIDLDAITVTSDGIIADGAVVAFASADRGKINPNFGFLNVSEIPYTQQLMDEEPHMKQWDTDYYRGKRLYRGPSAEDRVHRSSHNENMTITGRIASNNTGSEVMNLIEMTEILTPIFGQLQLVRDGAVLIGKTGPEMSVGIGMVVRERRGRIFGWNYGAGMTAHRSGKYAKTVKCEDYSIVAEKSLLAEYTIRALEAGLVPGLHLGCSPVTLSIAKAMGLPIGLDNITDDAWIELESVGITKESLQKPSTPLSREEVIARADEILPGIEDGKRYLASDICDICYVDCL